MNFFNDDDDLRKPAYKLWKSAAVVASGPADWGLDYIDAGIYAEAIAKECEAGGYQVPKADPGVIREYARLGGLAVIRGSSRR